MQTPTLDVDSIYAKNRQKTPQPNLFTILYIEHDKWGKIPITAEDIITVAEELVTQKMAEVKTALLPPKGRGTHTDPFLLETHQDWLVAINILETTTTINNSKSATIPERLYFKIGEIIIDIKTKDRYASDKNKDKEYVYEINIVATQLLKNALQKDGFEMLKAFIGKELLDGFDISKLVPLILSLITQLNAKIKPYEDPSKKPILDEPSYFTLAQLHANTFDITQLKDMAAKIRATSTTNGQQENISEEIEQALKAKLPNNNSPEMQLLKNPDALINFATSMLQSVANSGRLGNRNIEPFINEFLPLVRSILPTQFTTTEEFFTGLHNNATPHLQHEPNVPDWIAGDFKSLLRWSLSQLGNLTLDDKMIEKLNEYVSHCVLNETRLTLQNLASKANIYLPVTIASWFISEPARYKPAFLGSLIILDLIEAKSKLPDYPEISYNFYNALRNIERRETFIDGYGVLYIDRCKCNNNCEKCQKFTQYEDEKKQFTLSVLNMGTEETMQNYAVRILCKTKEELPKGKNRRTDLARQIANKIFPGPTTPEVGGYHPMTHHASYIENKAPRGDSLNTSQQKLASILLQWLQLQLDGSPIKASVDRIYYVNFPQSLGAIKQTKENIIKYIIRPLLNLRLRNFEFMDNSNEHVVLILATALKIMGIPSHQHTIVKPSLNPNALLLDDQNYLKKKPPESMPKAASLSPLPRSNSSTTNEEDIHNQLCKLLQTITGKCWKINHYRACYFSEGLDETEANNLVSFFKDKRITGKLKENNKTVRLTIDFQQVNLTKLQTIAPHTAGKHEFPPTAGIGQPK